MRRMADAAIVLLAVGVLAVVFLVIYQAGDTDPGAGPPVVDVR